MALMAVTSGQQKHGTQTLARSRGKIVRSSRRKGLHQWWCNDVSDQSLLTSAATIYEIGAPGGTCTHTLPADNGLLFYSATGALLNEDFRFQIANSFNSFCILKSAICIEMVGGAGNAPVVTSDVIFFDTGFTDRQSGHLPGRS